jgi:hypothetical protein
MVHDIDDLARAIQLALAPVFLLTGIAGLLNVMTGRLARIIDRGHAFAEVQATPDSADRASVSLERQMLEPRRHLVSTAITATTAAALLVCVMTAEPFVEVMLETPLKWLIGARDTAYGPPAASSSANRRRQVGFQSNLRTQRARARHAATAPRRRWLTWINAPCCAATSIEGSLEPGQERTAGTLLQSRL